MHFDFLPLKIVNFDTKIKIGPLFKLSKNLYFLDKKWTFDTLCDIAQPNVSDRVFFSGGSSSLTSRIFLARKILKSVVVLFVRGFAPAM